MSPEQILAEVATWAPEAIKLLDEGIHAIMSKPTEAEAVQDARDAASAAVDAYEAVQDGSAGKP